METSPKEIILFENVILNIQKFIPSLEKEMSLLDEDKFFLIEKTTIYAIVVMSLFLKNTYNYEDLGEYDKLHAGIIEQYKKFTQKNCGADNEKGKEYYWNIIKDGLFKKLTWIGLCESKEKVDKEKIVTTITMDSDLMKFNHPPYNHEIFKRHISQLVDEIESGVNYFKNFGIL